MPISAGVPADNWVSRRILGSLAATVGSTGTADRRPETPGALAKEPFSGPAAMLRTTRSSPGPARCLGLGLNSPWSRLSVRWPPA
ncbi:hypothetical protein KL938_005037 [Ogataea parapolymorpha]|nr:hypothetical protein KL938_005037 [Ogataea parapolymorpha]